MILNHIKYFKIEKIFFFIPPKKNSSFRSRKNQNFVQTNAMPVGHFIEILGGVDCIGTWL